MVELYRGHRGFGGFSSERLTLQQNKTLRVIKKSFVKKCLEMFAEIAEKKDDYKTFYKQFGKCLKLGIHEDPTNRTKIAVLLGSKSGDEQISMKEYIDHMKEEQNGIYYITDENITVVSSSRVIKKNLVKQLSEGQNHIYYISDESIAVVSSSLFLENLGKKGLDGTYMVDAVDE